MSPGLAVSWVTQSAFFFSIQDLLWFYQCLSGLSLSWLPIVLMEDSLCMLYFWSYVSRITVIPASSLISVTLLWQVALLMRCCQTDPGQSHRMNVYIQCCLASVWFPSPQLSFILTPLSSECPDYARLWFSVIRSNTIPLHIWALCYHAPKISRTSYLVCFYISKPLHHYQQMGLTIKEKNIFQKMSTVKNLWELKVLEGATNSCP